MNALTIVALSLFLERYPQLPPEAFCERMYNQAANDTWILHKQADLLAGWSRERVSPYLQEADTLVPIWWAAWWITWPKATDEQKDEWAGILAGWIGQEQFWRGEIPLPLSYRE